MSRVFASQTKKEGSGDEFPVEEVAEAAAAAGALVKLATSHFVKTRDRTKFRLNILRSEISQNFRASLRVDLAGEADVDIADKMVANVVGDFEFLNVADPIALCEDFLKKGLEMPLTGVDLCVLDVLTFGQSYGGRGICVRMFKEDGVRNTRFVVNSSASITMSTSTSFQVKWTCLLVYLCPKYSGQMFGHIYFARPRNFHVQ